MLLSTTSVFTQQTNNMQEKNPLLCDPKSGMCEMPEADTASQVNTLSTEKVLKIIYFTDPICSSCWGIEPQLRRLKLEYGDFLSIEYRMGGLLPDWSYNSGGISKPSDVAHHWDEVSAYYQMPIDGDVWLEDPLHSSYPPSIAFKAAELQDHDLAINFLREMREMVFLRKKNIARWENIEEAAKKTGLDILKLKSDFESSAEMLFKEDLELARKLGVRGFPTLFFIDTNGNKEIIYGSQPYEKYVQAIQKIVPSLHKKSYSTEWEYLFSAYPTLTLREFSELSGKSTNESNVLLEKLTTEGQLEKFSTKNGALWKIIK